MFKYSCVILGLFFSFCLYAAQGAFVPYGPYQPFQSDQQKWEDNSNFDSIMHYYHPDATFDDGSLENGADDESGSCAAGNEAELMEPEPPVADASDYAPSCALEGIQAPPLVENGIKKNNGTQDVVINEPLEEPIKLNNDDVNGTQEVVSDVAIEEPIKLNSNSKSSSTNTNTNTETIIADAPKPVPSDQVNQAIPTEKAAETGNKASETAKKAAETPEKRESSPYYRPRPNLIPQRGNYPLRYPTVKLPTPAGKSNQ